MLFSIQKDVFWYRAVTYSVQRHVISLLAMDKESTKFCEKPYFREKPISFM